MASAGQEKFDAQSSGRKSITPGFYGNKNKSPIKASDKDSDALKKDAVRDKKGAAAAAAEAGLAGAEKDAAGQEMNDADGVSAIGAKEASPIDKIANKVVGNSPMGKLVLSRLKNKGPVATIILLLFTVGGIMFGAQAMMPFSVAENLREKFDGLEIATNVRSNAIFRMQMKRQGLKTITSKRIFGGTYFKMSKNQANKLAQEGITMEGIKNSKGDDQNILLFDDGTGKQKIVVADQGDVELVRGAIKNGELEINGQKIKVDADDIQTHADRFETDGMYRNKIKKQTRTWAGSIGHWFDQKTAAFLDNFVITRKIFGKYIERVQGEDILDARARTSETIANSGATEDGGAIVEDSDTYDNGVKEKEEQYTSDVDEDGDGKLDVKTRKYDDHDNDVQMNTDESRKGKDFDETIDSNTKDGVTVNKTTTTVAKSKISKASLDKAQLAKQKGAQIKGILNNRAYKAAGYITTIGCAVLDLIGAALIISGAQETIELLKVASSFLETVDKTKAGDGDAAPINVLGNALTAKVPTVTYTAGDGEDFNFSQTTNEEEVNAMQSNGIASLYTDQKINPNDKSVKTFNLSEKMNSIVGSVTLGIESFMACSIAKIAAATVSLGITVGSIIAEVAVCVGTGFWGCIAVLLKEAGVETAKQVGKAAARASVMKMAMPVVTQMVANWFMRDLVSDLAGEHYGNAIVSAANTYMSSNFRAGGGSLTNRENYLAFRVAQEKVLAENARYERETRSPFDITSSHTFLGSIVKQAITLSTISTGPANIVSGLSTMVGNSVLALMPHASAADDINNDLMTQQEFDSACPYLASIGAVGDAYCNPYIISDMSSMGTHPDDIEEALLKSHDLETVTDEKGQQVNRIRDGSDLAKYVVFCSNRTSTFGVMDTNIANSISSSSYKQSGDSTLKAGGSIALNATPVVGDIASIFDDKTKLENTGWISGEACVAGNTTNYGWSSNGLYYQRYTEDQRLYTSIDPTYESAADKYWTSYLEKNPLDNSYEGVLARFSGLPKDTVVAVLDFMEYERELAEYDPSERYVFQNDFNKLSEPVFFEFEEQPTVALQQHEIVYADIRNRAFAMA